MTIDRTTIISGPALVQYDSQTFYSKGDITLKTIVNRTQINTSAFGIIDERATDKRIEVVFEPAGQFTDALAAVLWPYASTLPGESVFGAADKELVIWGRDGQKHTVKNARVTTMPNIQFGTTKTTIGSITFTGLVANSSDPTAIASYYTVAAADYPGDTTFDPGQIWTLAPTVLIGLTEYETQDGIDVSFSVGMRDEMVDGIGTVDMKIGNVEATATFIPIPHISPGLALEDVIGLDALYKTILISTPDTPYSPVITFNGILTEVENGWGDRKRSGQVSYKAKMVFDVGSPQALFTIAAQPTP